MDCGNPNTHENCHRFPASVITSIIKGETATWTGTMRKFERALAGKETSNEDSSKIWNSVAFTNYLQSAVENPREAGANEHYKEAVPAFFEVLELLRPEVIIGWGKRLYNNMTDENFKKGEDLTVGDNTGFTGTYRLADGMAIPILWINHPSTSFSWNEWHNVIDQFLSAN